MEILHQFRDWLLFTYYTKIRSEQKALFAVIGVIIIFTVSGSIAALTSSNRVITNSNAETALVSDFQNNAENRQSFSQTQLKTTSIPSPTVDPLIHANEQILHDALEALWKRIDAMPESQKRIDLNARAAAISNLLDEKDYASIQPLVKALIYDVDGAEYAINLSLTPSPTPTEIPTVTPTPTPTPNIFPESSAASYVSTVINTERGKFTAKVITVDLTMTRMMTVTANENDCSHDCPTKSLARYVAENNAFAGINGTYFCPPDYAECASKKNSFDFPMYDSRTGNWVNFNNLPWHDRAIILQDEKGIRFNRNPEKERYYHSYHVGDDWSTGYYKYLDPTSAAFVMAPGLLEDGNVVVNQYPLTDKQKAKSVKVGLGFNKQIVYAVVAYNVTIEEFGYVFKALGATNALNLDSGGSTAMWYGNYRVGPGRTLPNAIVFVKK